MLFFLLCRDAQLQAKHSRGFHPRRCGSPDAITPELVLPSSSLSAGAAWGDRHCPLLHSYQHLEFHINGKGILQSRSFFFFDKISLGFFLRSQTIFIVKKNFNFI
jgi:hypothetical protein